MSDIKELIERILSDEKLRNTKSFQNAVYRDEPIIQPASGMKNYIPEKIREMKQLAASQDMRYRSEAYIFYRQAKLMEDYEDDYEYHGSYFSYFPTYQKMRTEQLRGYFTWRSRVRRGEIAETSLSFVYLYIYELLHMIGSQTPEEGFDRLRSFCKEYGRIEPSILRYGRAWLIDYAAYYDVDSSLLRGMMNFDAYSSLPVLRDCDKHTDEELLAAICAVSSYNIKNSKLYKNCPDDVTAVVCSVYRSMSEYYRKHRTKSLFEKLFGRCSAVGYDMFNTAVFYDHKKYKERTYKVCDGYRILCQNGIWYCERYYFSRKNQWLGDVMRAADSIMRKRLDFGYPIACPCDTKWILSIIDKAIDDLIEDKKKKEAVKIEIDLSKLAGIRRSADVTRDMLMTDEESEDRADPQSFEEAFSEAVAAPQNDTPLDDSEYVFLHFLLYGGSFDGKIMTSVMVDKINEKLFDIFSDVVIDFDGDKPVVIEDYADELKGLIKE